MLKRLLELMRAAEAGRRARRTDGGPQARAHGFSGDDVRRGAIGQRNVHDFGAAYVYAISEGIYEEKAYTLGSAYAHSIAQGMSNAYAIVYAAAYSIACTIIGAPEEWARAYAQACSHAIAAQESIGFASMYGHAVADGTSPDDALAFARRYAA